MLEAEEKAMREVEEKTCERSRRRRRRGEGDERGRGEGDARGRGEGDATPIVTFGGKPRYLVFEDLFDCLASAGTSTCDGL